MKKTTLALAGLLIFLVGFQVSEFFRAPNNATERAKSKLAFLGAQHDLATLYHQYGRTALDEHCKYPVEKWGYYFSCYSGATVASTNEGNFAIVEVGLFRWRSKVEAEEMAAVRRSFDEARPNRLERTGYTGTHYYPELVSIAGANNTSAYYFNTFDWADAKFVEVQRWSVGRQSFRDVFPNN